VVTEPSIALEQWKGTWSFPPAANAVKAGRAIPLEFRVVDSNGAPVDDASVINLAVSALNCGDTSWVGVPTFPDDAGASSLRSKGDGWWTFT